MINILSIFLILINLNIGSVIMPIYIVNDKNEKEKITIDILKSLPTYFEDEEAIYDYADKAKDYVLFVKEENGTYLGFIVINCIDSDIAEIEVMGVNPKWFRKKIGTALFNEAYNYLKINNFKVIQVKTVKMDVYKEYDITNYFYKKLGFIEKEILDIWGEKNPCQLYELEIK